MSDDTCEDKSAGDGTKISISARQKRANSRVKRTITLSFARMSIFYLWMSSFLIYSIMFMTANAFRKQGVFTFDELMLNLLKLLSLIIPVLTAFASFWFRQGSFTGSKRMVEKEKWIAAIWLSGSFHLILLLYFIIIIYFHDYSGVANGEPGFPELTSIGIQLAMLLSPLATIPAAFLLGIESIQVGNAAQAK